MSMTCLTVGKDSLTRVKGGVAFAVLQLRAGAYILIMEVELDDGGRE